MYGFMDFDFFKMKMIILFFVRFDFIMIYSYILYREKG